MLEPWASGIIFGTKRVENRIWRTSHRGPLLIHAGKSEKLLAGFDPDALRRLFPDGRLLHPGHLLGAVDLVDCVPVAELAGVPWAEGPWCWILENPRPLPSPIPYRGQQLLYTVPEDRLPPSFR